MQNINAVTTYHIVLLLIRKIQKQGLCTKHGYYVVITSNPMLSLKLL